MPQLKLRNIPVIFHNFQRTILISQPIFGTNWQLLFNICFQAKWRLLFSSFTFSIVQSVKSSLTVCLLHITYLYQFHSHVPLVFSCVQYLFGISVLPLAALVFSWPTPPLLSVLHYLVAPFFFPQEL